MSTHNDDSDDDDKSTSNEESMSEDSDDEDMSVTDEEGHPFRDLVEEALRCYEEEYCQLTSRQQGDDDAQERSDLKRRISKTLRGIFVDYLLDHEDKKRDPLFKAIMRKAKDLRLKEDFDPDDAIRAAVSFKKHTISKLIPL